MSRVDQALRQAEHPAVLRPVADAPQQPVAGHPLQALDLYPTEPAIDGGALAFDVGIHAPRPELDRRPAFDPVPRQEFRSAHADKLVTGGKLPACAVEQYRRLAATLHQLQEEQNLRTVTVTSAVPQEGKTLTIVNLALTLSGSYNRRVLLIDADLRRPSVHDVFGTALAPGLYEGLRPAPTAVRVTEITPTLSVLPAGLLHGDPMVPLASEQMTRLLADAAASFDWVLLDGPPAAAMADAGLLVRLTRAVILVIAANSTRYKVVERVVSEIGRDNIVGTVLNGVDEPADGWPAYYGDTGPSLGQRRESLPAQR
ncbi:MAG TPA: CpsD/CapB family tyrosine-protein kinase [Vicinamibacterales bacterium]|jgi:capsular exopolysaccharide synthesis family protein